MNKVLQISYKNRFLLTVLASLLIVSCTQNTSETKPKTENATKIQSKAKINVTTDKNTQTVTSVKVPSKNKQEALNNSSFDCQQADKKLSDMLQMKAKQSEDLEANYDAVVNSNQQFRKTLTTYAQQAGSMQCELPLTRQEGLFIKTSEDNKLRTFTWDENTGGTMHYYAGLYQFKDAQSRLHTQGMGAIVAKIADDKYAAYDGIPDSLYTLMFNGKAQYMIAATEVLSNKNRNSSLQVFTINGNKLEPSNIIKTRLLTNKLRFQYDYFSIIDGEDRSTELFEYDDTTSTIRFPVVVADDKYPSGKVTQKFISYTFDGEYFQRAKN